MATSREAVSVEDSELSEVPDLIKCTICFEKLSCPRVLPCLHSFCERCLQLHMEAYVKNPEQRLRFLSTRTFKCPSCRETVDIPPAGVKGFRRDFRAEQIQDFLKTLPPKPTQHHRISSGNSDKDSYICCNSVKGMGNQGKHYCLNCKISFCEDCAIRHQSSPSFPNHQMQETSSNSGKESGEVKCCPTHGGERVEWFCLSCNEGICVVCSMTLHDKHNITEITTGLAGFHENAISLCHLMEKRLGQLRTINKHLNSCEKNLKVIQRDTKKKVKQHAEDLIQSIRSQEHKVLVDLEERCKKNGNRICDLQNQTEVSLVSVDSMCELVKDLTLNKEDLTLALVPVYREVIERMENLLETSAICDTDDLDVTFKFSPSTSKVKLGKILWQEEPNLNTETYGNTASKSLLVGRGSSHMLSFRALLNKSLQVKNLKVIGKEGSALGEFHMPRDLCFLSDGHIVVADTGNDRLQLLDSNGHPEKIWCQGQLRPWGVTADEKDILYVADAMGKCVVVVGKGGVILKRIGQFLCPCGIALTPGQDILVTDFFSPTAYLLAAGDGAILNQFDFRRKQDRHASGASYITSSPAGKIIISDVSNHCIKVYSLRGTRITKVSKSTHKNLDLEGTRLDSGCTPLGFRPQGVTSLEYDFLYVDGARSSVNLNSNMGGLLASFLNDNTVFRGLNGIAVLPQRQSLAMTDVLSHQVALLQPSRSEIHSIVGKLPRNVVSPNVNEGYDN